MGFLTQGQVEARLDALREQRDAIDRDIADCLAFLELGRRLGNAQSPITSVRIDDKPDDSISNETITDRSSHQRGRAIIASCIAILRQACRPMHASELLASLHDAGFEVGGTDPVASLNTRLWKRSGPGGPFRRLGDAVYDIASESDVPSRKL